MYHVPHSKGVVGLAANFVLHIAEQMQSGAGPRPAAASQATLIELSPRDPMDKQFFIGMDVGSTTVKAVVVDQATDQIVWSDYQRHDTKQPEKVLEFLQAHRDRGRRLPRRRRRAYSSPARAATAWSKYLGAKFVQEVNAVSLAVEKLYPECGSVIELGGQDAKIIIFKKDPGDRPQEENSLDER